MYESIRVKRMITNNITNSSTNTTSSPNGSQTTLDDILAHINPEAYQWVFLSCFFIVFVVGMTGNFLVCYAVWKSNQLKTVTNFFLVNLAAADFLVVLLCMPVTVVTDTLKSWLLGLAMCKFIVYIQKVSVFVSILTLTVISIERYLAILHPLTFHGESRRTRIIILIIWIVSLVSPTPDFMNMTTKKNEEVPDHLQPWLTRCLPQDEQMEKHLFIFYTVTFYMLPLVIMSFTYTKIAICLWSSASAGNAVAENLQHHSAIEQLKTRRRSAKMLIIVVITFAVCYLPIYTLNIYRYTDALSNMSQETLTILFLTSRLIMFLNSSINPVIYNFMSVKFRKQFRQACYGCHRCCFKSAHRGDIHASQYSMRSFQSRTNDVRVTFTSQMNSRSTSS